MSRRTPITGSLLWVTNLATPYRAPLWEKLSDCHPLTVALLAGSEPNRHWNVELDEDRYTVIRLNATVLRRSSHSVLYAPSRELLTLISERPRTIVLDGWESPAFLAARWWARRLGVPVLASYRSTLLTHRFTRGPIPAARRWFFNGADAVLTAGQASTDAVISMGIPRERVFEGFNTVDVARFASGASRFRSTREVPPGHHFIYVGQFIERKNLPVLLKAFAAMREENDTLTLVGAGPQGPELLEVAKELNLQNALTMTGSLNGEDLLAAYGAANTLVLPSTEEVWGLVVNEGLAAGLHAVVSATCGIAPSIDHMPGVFTAPPTISGLAGALRRSRREWTGPLRDHPVTLHTPHALSTVVLDTVDHISRVPG